MSVINYLESEQVASFDLSTDKKSIEVMECCDYYYKVTLNKVDVEKLIAELSILYVQLED